MQWTLLIATYDIWWLGAWDDFERFKGVSSKFASLCYEQRGGQMLRTCATLRFSRFPFKAIFLMVIDQADCLHIGVANRRTHEFEAAFFEVFGEGIGFGGAGGVVG